MALHDSDPERRNLMLMSLGFIAYFYAGGSIQESVLRIQVVNVTFSEPFVLAVMAWLLHFWFLYRYWLTHKTKFSDGFRREMLDSYQLPFFVQYASDKLGKPFIKPGETEGLHVCGFSYEVDGPAIKYVYASNVRRDGRTGRIEGYSRKREDEEGLVSIKGFAGLILRIRAALKCCVSNRSFSDYLVPYILFLIAMIGAAWRIVI